MNSSKKVAHAVGGKTARACDSCIKKRARWYCAADDAFLCEACDSAVHSANQLARRHERVLLKTASSLKPSNKDDRTTAVSKTSAAPSWHRGFTRKPRTPRGGKTMTHHGKSKEGIRNLFPQVPEVGGDDNNSYDEENEEDQQLLYRVPIFDPSVAELCSNSGNSGNSSEDAVANYEANSLSTVSDHVGSQSKAVSSLPNFSGHDGFLLPSDMDLAEFAADVDSLLGRGLNDDQCFGMEGLGLRDCKEKESNGRVKIEEDDDQEGIDGVDFMGCQLGESEIDMMREPFVLNFEDYDDSPASCGEQDDKMIVGIDSNCTEDHEHEEAGEDAIDNTKKRKTILRLDYEAVITAWDGSPWTSGDRPDFDSECLPDYMGVCAPGLHYPYGDLNGIGVHPAMVDGGREARVSRYREKRRTRLFSKKIRYEVRKLNAEKRPRMKGRFVKRSSFAGSAFPVLAK